MTRPNETSEQDFESIEAEYEHWRNRLLALELEQKTDPRSVAGIKWELQQVRSKLGKLKPRLKDERRTLHGKPADQRTRHDVMEDMLLELREIRRLLSASSVPSVAKSGADN